MKFLISISILSLLLCSCMDESKTDNKTTAEDKTTVETEENCTYSIAGPKTTSLTWTAYKFTDKVGVSGVFDEIYVAGKLRKNISVPKMLTQVPFMIITKSINSKNEERDPKILKAFFGNILKGDTISGMIETAKGTDRVGQCEATLSLNGIEKSVSLDYTFKDEKITLTGGLNLEDWNAQGAVSALNEVCSDLHKGADRVSKLWPDIDLVIESPVRVSCE